MPTSKIQTTRNAEHKRNHIMTNCTRQCRAKFRKGLVRMTAILTSSPSSSLVALHQTRRSKLLGNTNLVTDWIKAKIARDMSAISPNTMRRGIAAIDSRGTSRTTAERRMNATAEPLKCAPRVSSVLRAGKPRPSDGNPWNAGHLERMIIVGSRTAQRLVLENWETNASS